PVANATTDADIDTYLGGQASTIFHPLGSARVSAKGAQAGGVDPDLRVKGIAGLRVVDGSVLVSASMFFKTRNSVG
ncbi:hypothetical protein B0H17DRAFT_958015, partial [Mycena rosella]